MTFDIAKMMQNGQSADEIAKAFTDALNTAIADQKAKDTKGKDADTLAQHMTAFMTTHYPNLDGSITGAQIIDACDALCDLHTKLEQLCDLLTGDKDDDEGDCSKSEAIESVFDRFFKKYGL